MLATMTLEALLAYAHLLAIFALVVFLSSEAALCRAEWLNAAVVRRLVRVDVIYGLSALLVLATGLLRVYFGVKGSAWYWANPLLHVKLGLFVVMAGLSLPPTLAFRRWRRALDAEGTRPAANEVARVRRLVMIQAHLMPLIPLAAVFLARGYGH
jgi:putative membrane protein